MRNKTSQCHAQPLPTTWHKGISNHPGLPSRATQLFCHSPWTSTTALVSGYQKPESPTKITFTSKFGLPLGPRPMLLNAQDDCPTHQKLFRPSIKEQPNFFNPQLTTMS